MRYVSIDECKALCNRMTIVENGAMMIVGSLEQIKTGRNQGFNITIPLRDDETVKYIDDLKAIVENEFTSALHITVEYEVK